jgi:excisionase family DNA binding protein
VARGGRGVLPGRAGGVLMAAPTTLPVAPPPAPALGVHTLPPYTVDQAAQMLGCATSTVREHARAGRLPGLKVGEDWVFPAGALLACLDLWALAEAKRRATAQTVSSAPVAITHCPTGSAERPAAQPGKGTAGKRRRALPVLPRLQTT